MTKLLREPVVIIDVIVAVLALLVAFGVPISADQQQAIVDSVVKVLLLLAVVGGGTFVTRNRVTPVAAPRLPDGTIVKAIDDEGTVVHETQI